MLLVYILLFFMAFAFIIPFRLGLIGFIIWALQRIDDLMERW